MLKPCTSHLVDRVISTKVGATRRPEKSWVFFNTPENLRALKQKQIQMMHLRLMEYGAVLLEEQLGTMLELQRAGKILHVSLRSLTRAELEVGLKLGAIATVINMCRYAQHTTVELPYGTNPGGEVVRDLCEQHGISLLFFSRWCTACPVRATSYLRWLRSTMLPRRRLMSGCCKTRLGHSQFWAHHRWRTCGRI